ncbi:MAG: hypothetical protein RJB13_1209, partial [Pseudomonadota bacterium]
MLTFAPVHCNSVEGAFFMKIEISHTLDVISAQDWNTLTSPDFPFADYEHLSALEKTGCAGPQMGWLPIYLYSRDD